MLDELDDRQRYGMVAAAVFVAALGFGAGMMFPGSSPTGNVAADAVSEDEVRQEIQGLMDQQLQQQRQQFALIANQSENISEDDLSLSAEVTDVSVSEEMGSLYEVTVAVTGTVPSRTGGLRSLDQEQTMYVTQNGRYLFQQPQDLEQPQQPQQPQVQ